MKILKIVVVAVVILSGFMNMMLLGKVNDLENQVNNLQHQNSQINSTIVSIPGQVNAQVNNLLNQIKKIESWITGIQLELEDVQENSINMKANWQIKDFKRDSEVVFHYQIEGEEFTRIPATMKDNGYFEVAFPLEVELKPAWQIEFGGSLTERTVQAIEKARYNERKENIMNYYVSVNNQVQMKSSEMNHYNLMGISNQVYGTLLAFIDAKDGEISNITVHTNVISKDVNLTNVISKVYKNGELVSTQQFNSTNPPEENHQSYSYRYAGEEQDYDRLVIEATFSDGKTFSSEAYTK